MRIMSSVAVSLLLCTVGYSQFVVSPAPSAKELDGAKGTVAKAAPQVLKLKVGEFQEVIPDEEKFTTPLQWLATRSTAFEKFDIAAGESFGLIGKRAGDDAAKRHKFPARKFPWQIFVAVEPGEGTTYLNKNGDDAKGIPPQCVAEVTVVVEGQKPKPKPDDPVVPVDDELTKIFRTAYAEDAVSGRASREVLLSISDIYEALAASDLSSVRTHKQMDEIIYAAMSKQPAPDKILTSVRKAIMAYLYKRHGITASDSLKPIDLTVARDAFNKIAVALEAITK